MCLRTVSNCQAFCAEAYAAANSGEIVTFAVTPDHPAPGDHQITPARRWRSIPMCAGSSDSWRNPTKRARAFIEDGCLWNSGNFVVRADVMLEELQRFEPEDRRGDCGGGVGCEKKYLGFIVLDSYWYGPFPIAPLIQLCGVAWSPQASRARRQPR